MCVISSEKCDGCWQTVLKILIGNKDKMWNESFLFKNENLII